jgi:hypothetical protein
VLVAIAFPSFKLLYLMDEVIDPAITVKVTGSNKALNYIICTNNKLYIKNKIYKLFLIRNFYTKMRSKDRIGPHDEDVISVFIGSLLGDCYAERRGGKGTNFSFKQSIIHKDYLF